MTDLLSPNEFNGLDNTPDEPMVLSAPIIGLGEQKKANLINKSVDKQNRLQQISLAKNPVHDGDGVGDYRLAYAEEVLKTFDAYETTKDAKWLSIPRNQIKMAGQRQTLATFLGVPTSEVTNEDVFRQGEIAKKALYDKIVSGQLPVPKDFVGAKTPTMEIDNSRQDPYYNKRTLADLRLPDGSSLNDFMNRPEYSGNYYSQYNIAKTLEDRTNRTKSDNGKRLSDDAIDTYSGAAANIGVKYVGASAKAVDKVLGAVASVANVSTTSDVTKADRAMFKSIQAIDAKVAKDTEKEASRRAFAKKFTRFDEEEYTQNLKAKRYSKEQKAFINAPNVRAGSAYTLLKASETVESTFQEMKKSSDKVISDYTNTSKDKKLNRQTKFRTDKAIKDWSKGDRLKAAGAVLSTIGKGIVNNPQAVAGVVAESLPEMLAMVYAAPVAFTAIANDRYRKGVEDFKKNHKGVDPNGQEMVVIGAYSTAATLIDKVGAEVIAGKGLKGLFKPLESKALSEALGILAKKTKVSKGTILNKLLTSKPAKLVGGVVVGGASEFLEEGSTNALEQLSGIHHTNKSIDKSKMLHAATVGAMAGSATKAAFDTPKIVKGGIGSLVSKGEGGYGSFNKGQAGDAHGATINFNRMTVGEMRRRQSLPRGHNDRIFTVGKYQITPDTMKLGLKAIGAKDTDYVTNEMQENIFKNYLMKDRRPAIRDYIMGKSTNLEGAKLAGAMEWASIGVNGTKGYKGRRIKQDGSYYSNMGNNAAFISHKEFGNALQQTRIKYNTAIKAGKSKDEAWNIALDEGFTPSMSNDHKTGIAALRNMRTETYSKERPNQTIRENITTRVQAQSEALDELGTLKGAEYDSAYNVLTQSMGITEGLKDTMAQEGAIDINKQVNEDGNINEDVLVSDVLDIVGNYGSTGNVTETLDSIDKKELAPKTREALAAVNVYEDLVTKVKASNSKVAKDLLSTNRNNVDKKGLPKHIADITEAVQSGKDPAPLFKELETLVDSHELKVKQLQDGIAEAKRQNKTITIDFGTGTYKIPVYRKTNEVRNAPELLENSILPEAQLARAALDMVTKLTDVNTGTPLKTKDEIEQTTLELAKTKNLNEGELGWIEDFFKSSNYTIERARSVYKKLLNKENKVVEKDVQAIQAIKDKVTPLLKTKSLSDSQVTNIKSFLKRKDVSLPQAERFLTKVEKAVLVHTDTVKGVVSGLASKLEPTSTKPFELKVTAKPDAVKAPVKLSMATQYIGIGNKSTGSYAKQLTDNKVMPVNSGKYSSKDTVFVSVNGSPSRANYKATLAQVTTALEAGAKILTDSKAYLAKSTYNKGEQALANDLEKAGYIYSDVTKDNTTVGQWVKPVEIKKPTKREESNLDKLTKNFNPKSTSQLKKLLFTDLKIKPIVMTKAGNPSTSLPALRKLQKAGLEGDAKTFVDNLVRRAEAISANKKQQKLHDKNSKKVIETINKKGTWYEKTFDGIEDGVENLIKHIEKEDITYTVKVNSDGSKEYTFTKGYVPKKKKKIVKKDVDTKPTVETLRADIRRAISKGTLSKSKAIKNALADYTSPTIEELQGYLANQTPNKSKDTEVVTDPDNAIEHLLKGNINPTINSQANITEVASSVKDSKYTQSLKPIYNMVSQAKKTSSSIIGNSVNFLTSIQTKEGFKEVVDTYDLNTEAEGQLEALIQDWLVPFHKEYTENTLRSWFGNGKQHRSVLGKAPADMFRDIDGVMTENVVTATAIATREWLATKSMDTLMNDEGAINSLLGKPKDSVLPDGAEKTLQEIGTLLPNAQDFIGRSVLKQLNLKLNDDIDGNFETRLITSFGEYGLVTLKHMGDVEFTSVTSEVMQTLNPEFQTDNKEAEINFVRLKAERTDTGNGLARVNEDSKESIETYKEQEELNKALFDLEKVVKVNPTEVVTTAPDKMKKTYADVAPLHKEAIIENQKVQYKPKKNIFKFMARLGKLGVMQINGYVDNIEERHIEERNGLKGKNREAEKGIDAILEFHKQFQDADGNLDYETKISMELESWSNARNGFINKLINPQNTKLHRFAFDATDWDATIEMSNVEGINAHKRAIVEALGGKISSTVIEDFDTGYVDEKGNVNSKWAEAVAIINSGDAKFTDAERKVVLKAISEEGGEKYHSMDGLVALAEYTQALTSKDKVTSITTNLAREVDGTTNGVINAHLQLLPPLTESVKHILRRGGLFFKGDPWKNAQEYLESKGALDNYENIAKKMTTHFKYAKDKLSDQDKAKFVVLEELFGKLVIEETLEGIKVFTVSKGARNMAKYPLMTIVYSAGNASIKEEIVNSFKLDVYKKLAEAKAKGDKTGDYTDLLVLQQQVGILIGKKGFKFSNQEFLIKNNKVTNSKDPNYPLHWVFPKGDFDTASLIDRTYGTAMVGAVDEVLGGLKANSQAIVEAVRLSAEISKIIYERRVVEKTQLKGHELSKKEKDEIMYLMQRNGELTSVKNPASTGFNDSTPFGELERVPLENKEDGSVQTRFNAPITKIATTLENGEIVTKESDPVTTNTTTIKAHSLSGDIGVKGFLTQNIGFDAYVNSRAMLRSKMLHVFDAQMINSQDVMKDTKPVNRDFLEVNRNHSIMKETQKTVVRALQQVQKFTPKEKQALQEALFGGEKALLTRGTTNETTGNSIREPHTKISDWFKLFNETVYQVEKNRDQFFDEVISSEQFRETGTAYKVDNPLTAKVTPDQATTERIENMEKQLQTLKDLKSKEKKGFLKGVETQIKHYEAIIKRNNKKLKAARHSDLRVKPKEAIAEAELQLIALNFAKTPQYKGEDTINKIEDQIEQRKWMRDNPEEVIQTYIDDLLKEDFLSEEVINEEREAKKEERKLEAKDKSNERIIQRLSKTLDGKLPENTRHIIITDMLNSLESDDNVHIPNQVEGIITSSGANLLSYTDRFGNEITFSARTDLLYVNNDMVDMDKLGDVFTFTEAEKKAIEEGDLDNATEAIKYGILVNKNYYPRNRQKVTEAIRGSFNSTFESLINEKDFENVLEQRVTAETVQDVYDELGNKDKTNIDASHKERLDSLMEDLITPFLKKVDRVKVQIQSKTKYNEGRINGKNIFINIGSSVTSAMPIQEVFTHEIAHAIWDVGLNGNTFARRELVNLFKDAQKQLEAKYGKNAYEIFLDKDANGNNVFVNERAERKVAKQTYGYIFDNKSTDTLSEFGTFALTNQKFIEALKTLKKSKKKLSTDKSFLDNLVTIFSKILDFIASKFYGTDTSKSLDQSVLALAGKVNEISIHHSVGIIAKAKQTVDSTTGRLLIQYVVQPLTTLNSKALKTLRFKSSKYNIPHKLATIATGGFNIALKLTNEPTRKVTSEVLDRADMHRDNILRKTYVEMSKPSNSRRSWNAMLRQVKKLLDGQAEATTSEVATSVEQGFDPDKRISDKDWMKLNNGVLKTSLHNLINTYSLAQIGSLMRSEQYLSKKIKETESKLRASKEYNFYRAQAEGLGKLMATGNSNIEMQYKNVDTIVKGHLIEGFEVDSKAESLIDELSTLYAIKHTDSDVKATTARYIKHEGTRKVEYNGIETMMSLQQNFEQESLDRLFQGNKLNTIKGWTVENTNSDIDMQFVTANKMREMENQGYINHGLLDKSKQTIRDPNKTKVYLMTSRTAALQRWQSGIVSTVAQHRKGSSIEDIYQRIDAENDVYDQYAISAQVDLDKMRKQGIKVLQRQRAGNYKYEGTNPLSPTVTADGIHTFSYLMNEETKVELLGKEDKANVVLGQMYGSIIRKTEAKSFNKKVVIKAHDEFMASYRGNEHKFTKISIDSDNAKYKEYFEMMPYDMRQDLKQTWGGDYMYIKTDLLDMVLGFRKFSFTNWLDSKLPLHKELKRTMLLTGQIWQAVVSRAKRNVVILTPAVLAANVVSNMVLSVVKGVPFTYALKYQSSGVADIISYQEMLTKVNKAKRHLKANPKQKNRKALETKIHRLETELAKSPVHDLIEEGTFQTIVEDVTEKEDSLTKAVSNAFPETAKKLKGASDAIPDKIKDIYHVAVISPNTKLGKILTNATQYSDFVARYAMYRYLTEVKKVDKKTAIEDIMDTFIDYNENTSKAAQYVNDIGILMYTKFLFRIQRVILQIFSKHPATAIGVEVLQQALGNLPDIPDAFLPFKMSLSRLSSPEGLIDDAFQFNILNYLSYLIPH
jgi:hypothetical protein